MEPLVSVIIPVYNMEAYLVRCLDSVCTGTYRNLEIICVDDGSRDRSLEILREYKALDSRIIVIAKENGGVSSARNAALDRMTGEYVTFIDADDSVHPQYVELMIEAMLLSHTDCVFAGHKSISNESEAVDDACYELNAKDVLVLSSVEACKHTVVNSGICSRLIPRDIVAKTRFPVELAYGEDTLFTLELLQNNPTLKVGLVSFRVYYYWIREGSLVTKGRDQNILRFLSTIASLASAPEKEQIYLEVLFRRGLYFRYLYIYCQKERQLSKGIGRILKSKIKQLLRSRHFSPRYKLTRTLYSLFPGIERRNRLRLNPQLREKET